MFFKSRNHLAAFKHSVLHSNTKFKRHVQQPIHREGYYRKSMMCLSMMAVSSHCRVQLIYEGFKSTPVCHHGIIKIELRCIVTNKDACTGRMTVCGLNWCCIVKEEKERIQEYDGIRV
ncbi:hypothetical protein TNCT_63151 [Trichonephila clavata]|uniref:Uncharacterized protein n=1 Tax=Trichonephila clavata TaxID=2740835 RepID=A0A8X6J2U5_TRICU|nr:hypothetical protein TNCT_63151 [Trichonephila clavata]